MNGNKELKHSKSKVQWWAIFAIIGIILTITSCEKDSQERYPSLKVMNQSVGKYIITGVSLAGYEFSSLYIPAGASQTFALDQGMPAGYNDINIDVTYLSGGITLHSSKKVNFSKGDITTLLFDSGTLEY